LGVNRHRFVRFPQGVSFAVGGQALGYANNLGRGGREGGSAVDFSKAR